MSYQRRRGPRLPKGLIDQLPGEAGASGSNRRQKGGFKSRKELRKAIRVEKKAQRQPEQPPKKLKPPKQAPPTITKPKRTIITPKSSENKAIDSNDAEILALEKKLGIKSAKLPKSFAEDGLDDLFDEADQVLVSGEHKRKRNEYDSWLESKRQKQDSGEDSEDSRLSEDESSELDQDFEGFEFEDSSENAREEFPKVRENPYVPPVTVSNSTAKYVPPSLRKPAENEVEQLSQLRRKLQGLLNRLSGANLSRIVQDVEKIYREHARQHVSSTLIDLLVGLVADPTTLRDTFLTLHAGFIAALYKVIGMQFGAQFLERIVTEFDRFYSQGEQLSTKEPSNIITLLSGLYTFEVVGRNIMFDFLRMLLSELSPINTELLLKMVQTCGPKVRKDDPSSLKDIVRLMQDRIVERGGVKDLPERTKFMIDTIISLKNNRLKFSALLADEIESMKKTLRTLSTHTSRANEPLGIGLKDLRSAQKDGKWWLVGSSWRGTDQSDPNTHSHVNGHVEVSSDLLNTASTDEIDLNVLAREQGMNTDVRRVIFVTIMSSINAEDAYQRLHDLRPNRTQSLEIPRIVLHCVAAERNYNPYYTVLAKMLCTKHTMRKAFQYGLWGIFRRMGEDDLAGDAEAYEQGNIEVHAIANWARFYGDLIARGLMPITVLKILNFQYLQPKPTSFLNAVLAVIFQAVAKESADLSKQEKHLVEIFSKSRDAPQMLPGLQYFLHKVFKPYAIVSSADEQKILRRGYRSANDVLEILKSKKPL